MGAQPSSGTPEEIRESRRDAAASSAWPDSGGRRHVRKNPLSHHKGQEHEVSGGRTAAKHHEETDNTRSRGRVISQFARDVLDRRILNDVRVSEHPDSAARRIDPVRATPLPPDHPEVLKEIKFDRISRLMQPGSNDEVDQELGLDENDDWIS